ncbi:MAG: hypothetical protein WA776_13300 [Xanthobacteraceae bacterium]
MRQRRWINTFELIFDAGDKRFKAFSRHSWIAVMVKVLIAVIALIAAVMIAGVHFHFNPAIPIFVILGFGLCRSRASADRHCRRATTFHVAQVTAYTCAAATTPKTMTRIAAKIRAKTAASAATLKPQRVIPANVRQKHTRRNRCDGSWPSRP